MTNNGIDLDGLAARCDAAFPPLNEEQRRIALSVHRVMAREGAASPSRIASAARAPERVVESALRTWPGVFRDEDGRVIGFWGLSLAPMPHRMKVGGRDIYGWCAWDTLFLPEIIGADAEVESLCPVVSRQVTLRVTSGGVEDLHPASAVVSLLEPDPAEVGCGRVISSFCHHIVFLSSREVGERWVEQDGKATLLLTVPEAWELGRRVNRVRYGQLVGRDDEPARRH